MYALKIIYHINEKSITKNLHFAFLFLCKIFIPEHGHQVKVYILSVLFAAVPHVSFILKSHLLIKS